MPGDPLQLADAHRSVLSGLPVHDVTVEHDPEYDTTKRYRAWRLADVLQRVPGVVQADATAEIRFVAADGYTTRARLEALRRGSGYVAFEDLDAPDGQSWTPFPHGKQAITPAPFYVVWTDTGGQEHLPHPFQLKTISLVVNRRARSRAEPAEGNAAAQRGHEIFERRCMSCHSINLVGGTLGPELNVPKNVTEYWRRDDLPAFILDPASYRAHPTMPPARDLEGQGIADIIAYLEAMKAQKVCRTASECESVTLVR